VAPVTPPQMLVTATQPLHDASGQTFAYFVPADEMDRMRSEIEALKQQVEALSAEAAESQRQLAVASGIKPLPPMTEAEPRALMAGPHVSFADVIAELDGGSCHAPH
jgi:hypothetical protein